MSEDTRNRVLNAAGPIFAAKGFETATVREICLAAGVNLASVNYHFGDKEHLYLETVRLAHQSRTRQVPADGLSGAMAPEDKLRAFIHMTLGRMLATPGHDWQTGLFLREMLHPTHACRALVEEFIRPNHDMLLVILDDFLPAGTPPHRREQVALSIIGQCLLYRVAREFVGILIPEEERAAEFQIDQLAEHITAFSTAALREMNKTAPITEREPA